MPNTCSVRDGKFVTACRTLREATSGVNPRGNAKGIYALALSNREGPTRTFYTMRGGDFPKGMVLNFCPFCGEDISAPLTQKEST